MAFSNAALQKDAVRGGVMKPMQPANPKRKGGGVKQLPTRKAPMILKSVYGK